jgi:hypothetical protein
LEEQRLRLFQNRALREIFRFKREEVTVDWRKLHNEELLDLCPSPSSILLIKSKSMRWAGHMSHMWGNVKVETNLEDSGMGGRIILDIKNGKDGSVDWVYLVQDSCGYSNEPSGIIEGIWGIS